MYVCTACMPGACGGQRKVSDFLEIELQMAGYELPAMWVLGIEPGSSLTVLLTAEPSLEPHAYTFFQIYAYICYNIYNIIYVIIKGKRKLSSPTQSISTFPFWCLFCFLISTY